MPLDENSVLHDGTAITGDITPTSATRADGSAVLDVRKSPAKGISVQVSMGAALEDPLDSVLITIEESAAEASGFVELARVTLTGVISPVTYFRLVNINKRYVRAKIDITDDSSSGFLLANLVIALTPYRTE